MDHTHPRSGAGLRTEADSMSDTKFYVAAQFATDGPHGKDGAILAANAVVPLYEVPGQKLTTIHRDGVVYLGFVGEK